MEEGPPKSVFFHFRFKFLAITNIAFLVYVILSGSADFEQFSSSPQFKLIGPFFLAAGVFYLIFKRFPVKCPYCFKILANKKDWECPHCGQSQGKDRFLVDKCAHCRQLSATGVCEHCKQEFRL
ncbi:MAG TPA: hypothetical protein VJ936_07960 [Desulfobacteraceae bacterium]|nr:hypothetical protein [Desulfobacteraceae bacterium]